MKRIGSLDNNHLNDITAIIIDAAINVHKELGPGLLESVYNTCMVIELESRGITTVSEVALPVIYRGQQVSENGLRIDLLVEDTVIVELKSVKEILPIHKKQLFTYLRLANKPVGLLINFNNSLLKDGITRIVNSPKGDVSLT